MGYDQPEKSGSSGAVVAVLVAVLLVVLLGGLFVVGVGAFFWLGTANVQRQAVDVEMEARMETEPARAMAEEALVEALVEAEVQRQQAKAMAQMRSAAGDSPTSGSQREFKLSISQDGMVSVDGEQIDLAELRARLEKLRDDSNTPVSVQIDVAPDCPREHLVSVLDACDDVVNEVTFRMSPSESVKPATEDENAAK